MGLLRSTNRASAPLNAAITSGATSVVLTAGKGALFPALAANEYFYAVIQKGVLDTDVREYVKVTARAGDTLTITRAQGGSTAQAFAAGDVLALIITAESLEGFVMRDGEVAVPSAATVDLWTSTKSEDIEITGTTNISSFGTTAPIGTVRNLRFSNAAPGKLIHSAALTCPGGADYQCGTNDVVTVRRLPGGNWLVVNISTYYNPNAWEKIHDWTPTAINNVAFTWDTTRYRRIRVSINGVKSGTTGNANDDLYMQVFQNTLLKSGTGDYYVHYASWYGSSDSVQDQIASYMHLTYGGQGNTPEEIHGELFVDANNNNRAGVTGITRSLSNGGLRCVSLIGHQVLVQDAVVNGILIGFANGGIFFTNVGSIVLEGLRR